LFFTGIKMFGKRAAFFIMFLYIVNPFTSAFTGLKLSEIITIFYFTMIMFIISLSTFNKSKLIWFSWGIFLGLLIFTRQQYLFFVLITILIFAFVFFEKFYKLFFIIFSIFGIFSICWYLFIANYVQYKVITITPPYTDTWGGGFYSNFYNDSRYNEVANSSQMNLTFVQLASQFHDIPLSDKLEYEKMYKTLFFQKIRIDWPIYLKNTLRNMLWLWDKEHLYQYVDRFYPYDKWSVRVGNIILLVFCVIGLVRYYLINQSNFFRNKVVLFSLILFSYITIIFSLVSNESRHTIAAYSLLIYWSGYGLSIIKFKRKH
jgi:hypothetical protein